MEVKHRFFSQWFDVLQFELHKDTYIMLIEMKFWQTLVVPGMAGQFGDTWIWQPPTLTVNCKLCDKHCSECTCFKNLDYDRYQDLKIQAPLINPLT